MPDAGQIVSRLRRAGANLVLDGDAFRVVNSRKLPPSAADFLAQHRDAIMRFLRDEQGDFDERAAIIEFEGRTPRQWAEAFADILIRQRPPNISDVDWSWFVTVSGRIIDETPAPEGSIW